MLCGTQARRRTGIAVIAAVLVALLSVATASAASARAVWITKHQYGKRWPFTVNAGGLACVHYSSVIFTSRGITYAVNGTAKGEHRYANIEKIWRFNPAYPRSFGLRIDIGPIIDRGLKLC